MTHTDNIKISKRRRVKSINTISTEDLKEILEENNEIKERLEIKLEEHMDDSSRYVAIGVLLTLITIEVAAFEKIGVDKLKIVSILDGIALGLPIVHRYLKKFILSKKISAIQQEIEEIKEELKVRDTGEIPEEEEKRIEEYAKGISAYMVEMERREKDGVPSTVPTIDFEKIRMLEEAKKEEQDSVLQTSASEFSK